MAKLGDLLNTPIDELVVPLIPTGTWRTRVVSGRESEEKTDKNGKDYKRALLTLKPIASAQLGDIDDDEMDAFTDANGFDETVLYFDKFLYTAADVLSMANKLKAAGASTKGESLASILSNGVAGLEFMAEVTHEVYQDEPRARCGKIFAAD